MTSGFTEVDAAQNPRELVTYLDLLRRQPGMALAAETIPALLGAKPGDLVLDIGCGTGDDAIALATAGARVTGIDASETMIEEARRRTSGQPVTLQVADAHDLPFPDASFDAVLAHRVLQHVRDPQRVIAEMARVARPGAFIVAVEPDWETLVVDATDRDTTRVVLHHRMDGIAHGWIGRRLRAAFLREGLSVELSGAAFQVTEYALAERLFRLEESAAAAAAGGAVSKSSASAWTRSLHDSSMRGEFFASVTVFIARGRRPVRKQLRWGHRRPRRGTRTTQPGEGR